MNDAKILIADDEQFVRNCLARQLRKEKYQVTCVTNGMEAKNILQKDRFDLVISDVMMPKLDGMELLSEINKTSPETSVILITGYGSKDAANEALLQGADDYLLKPWEADELLFRVSRCLQIRRLVRKTKEQNHRLRQEVDRSRQLEEKLRENEEKTRLFSYSIAHDIRSPAISIQGLAKLFEKKFDALLPEKRCRYLRQIHASSQQIVTLADQINAFIQAKEISLKPEWVPLQQMIELLRKEFELQFDSRRIKWVEPKDMPTICADRAGLLRVLRNYIENALKYGGEQLRTIAVNYRQTPGFHTLSVRNDGTRVGLDECKTIFELFRREKNSTRTQGVGLGLAIAKEIIEQHKGEVWAEPCHPTGMNFFASIAKDLQA